MKKQNEIRRGITRFMSSSTHFCTFYPDKSFTFLRIFSLLHNFTILLGYDLMKLSIIC